MRVGVKERYDKFALTYCLNAQNGADAYRTTYPKCKSGHRQCARSLLAIPYVKDKINKIMATLAVKNEVTLDEVVANARLQVMLGKAQGCAADIKGGNEQLGKIIAAFKDRIEIGADSGRRPPDAGAVERSRKRIEDAVVAEPAQDERKGDNVQAIL